MIGLTNHPPIYARPALGQAVGSAVPVRILVADVKGKPISGASVRVAAGAEVSDKGETDGNGLFTAHLVGAISESTPVTVDVTLGPYSFRHRSTVGEGVESTIAVSLPVCASQPFLTVPEILALLAGAAITTAGYHWKLEPMKVTGEVLVGATVFTAIYRLSCL
jgi:hypothetical protein